jgi:hypothetical protein
LFLDVKVEENKETPDLLSLPIIYVCGIAHARVNCSRNPTVNLVEVLYFGIFFKNLRLLYIGMKGVFFYYSLSYIQFCGSEMCEHTIFYE